MSNLQLRPYQQECLKAIKDNYAKGVCRQLIHLPTASGKTVIFSNLIKEMPCRSLVVAHTTELLEQAREKIQMICPGLDVGLVNANSKEFDKHVVVSSLQSARQPSNLSELQKQNFGLFIYDECHFAAADSAKMVLDSLGFGQGTSKLLVGFTATPSRTDHRGLGEVFDSITFEKSVKEMVADGYLCKPRGIKIALDLDLSKITTDRDTGDFCPSVLAQVMDTPEVNELIATTYLERGGGRKAIAFGTSINHAENMARHFQAKGVAAEFVHGNMSPKTRTDIIQRYKDGQIPVLCNCLILTVGFDDPSTSCIIVGRPTQSKGLYQQMAGRGLRLFPNKTDCLILDFGRGHSLCSTSVLCGDAETVEHAEKRAQEPASFAVHLPPELNQKLRSAILNFDPLGEQFTWQREEEGYQLKGSGHKVLRIIKTDSERFGVSFINGDQVQLIASNLSFEFAFGSAEDFAKANRALFAVSDLEAEWRKSPISERQKALLRSKGFRAGIDDLTKGQASLIISSGILNKKTAFAVTKSGSGK